MCVHYLACRNQKWQSIRDDALLEQFLFEINVCDYDVALLSDTEEWNRKMFELLRGNNFLKAEVIPIEALALLFPASCFGVWTM